MAAPPETRFAEPRPAGARVLRPGALGLLFVAALGMSACGRKGPPRPPQYVIPQSPAPVRVASTPEGLDVTWRRPREYADGTDLEDLGSFDVFRSCAEGDPWVTVATLAVTDQERFRKGKTFSYLDRTVAPDAPCRYRVVAATLDGYRSPPAEGGLGDPEPTPEPTPTVTPSPTAWPGGEDLDRAPGRDADDEALRVPAPLVSPTPFPPAPW